MKEESLLTVKELSKKHHAPKDGQKISTLKETLVHTASNLLRPHLFWQQPQQTYRLKKISFEVMRGERIALLGANGAGKSTLLKVLSRVIAPTEGKVEIRGRVASLLEVGTGFHPELTGRENIFLNGAILGMSKREIQEKFEQIVDFAEIRTHLEMAVKRYSSGMYMRLAFSIAVHLDPDLFIVDEVLSVGDSRFQAICLDKLHQQIEQKSALLLVSHNEELLKAFCNKGLYLKQGELVSFGSLEECLQRYKADQGTF